MLLQNQKILDHSQSDVRFVQKLVAVEVKSQYIMVEDVHIIIIVILTIHHNVSQVHVSWSVPNGVEAMEIMGVEVCDGKEW